MSESLTQNQPEVSSQEPSPEKQKGPQESPQETPQSPQPPKRKGLFGWLFSSRKEKSQEDIEDILEMHREMMEDRLEAAELKRAVDLAEGKLKLGEIKDPKELIDFIQVMDAKKWRKKKIEERYGPGCLGKIKAFLAGEYFFETTPDGRVRRNALTELSEAGRAFLRILWGRRIILGGGALAIAGVLTGGIAPAAALALCGAVGGSAVAELRQQLCGKENDLRQQMVMAQVEQWQKLRRILNEIKTSEKIGEKIAKTQELIESVYTQDQATLTQEAQLRAEIQKLDKIRGNFILLGGLAGIVGPAVYQYMTQGLSGLAHLFGRIDIDGNRVFHSIRQINKVWHYLYQSATEAAKAKAVGASIIETAEGPVHLLGETSARIATAVAKKLVPQFIGLFGGVWLAGISARRALKRIEEGTQEEERTREYERKKQTLIEQLPKPETLQKREQKLRELAQQQGKPYPEVDDIWIIKFKDPATREQMEEQMEGYYKIKSIREDGTAEIIRLGRKEDGSFTELGSGTTIFSLEDILKNDRISPECLDMKVKTFFNSQKIKPEEISPTNPVYLEATSKALDTQGHWVEKGRQFKLIQIDQANKTATLIDLGDENQPYIIIRLPILIQNFRRIEKPVEISEVE